MVNINVDDVIEEMEVDPKIEKSKDANKRLVEEKMVYDMIQDVIDIGSSDDDESIDLTQKVKEEIEDMFNFSDTEVQEERDFDHLNELNDFIPKSLVREPIQRAETSSGSESAPTQ